MSLETDSATASTVAEPSRHLDHGAVATALTVGINAIGGLAFWFIAAQRFSTEQVGSALGLFQALLFVHYLTQLGLPVVIGHYAAGRDQRSSHITNMAMDVRALVTVAVAGLFLLITWQAEIVAPLRAWGPALGSVTFVALAIGAGLGTLAEMRLVTLRAWPLVVARTAVPIVLRIPAVLLLSAAASGYDVFLAAAAPICLAGLVAAAALRRTVDRAPGWRQGTAHERNTITRYGVANWASMLATEGPIFAAPVIVAASVSASDNAPFLVAWNISAMTFVLPYMISQVVLSETGDRPDADDLVRAARRAYLLAQTLTCTITVVAWAGAGIIADVYGPDYGDLREQLPILVGANIAWVVTTISLSVARTREQSRQVIGLGALFAASTLLPTLVLAPQGGTRAAGLAWFFGNCITGVVALWLQRDIWRRRSR